MPCIRIENILASKVSCRVCKVLKQYWFIKKSLLKIMCIEIKFSFWENKRGNGTIGQRSLAYTLLVKSLFYGLKIKEVNGTIGQRSLAYTLLDK